MKKVILNRMVPGVVCQLPFALAQIFVSPSCPSLELYQISRDMQVPVVHLQARAGLAGRLTFVLPSESSPIHMLIMPNACAHGLASVRTRACPMPTMPHYGGPLCHGPN